MFDIDHFKSVNDTHGHQAGDTVIRETAKLLRKAVRATDICGRYGGEEFAVILVGADAKQALIFAERLRQLIETTIICHEKTEIRCTISLGVTQLDEKVPTHIAWIACADQALYESKHNGRNRATVV
jgi:diguanylate cyclase (GGDEF)-like protein